MAKKLKIAVQFFGHLRTYKECAPMLKKHLLDKYDCDLFMHTWNTINHNTKTWHNNKPDMATVKKSDITDAYGEFKSIAIEQQHPKDQGDAQFKTHYGVKEPSRISIFGIASLYYTMRQVNAVRQEYEKKHNIKYDFVIAIRPDILMHREIDIENILSTLSPADIDNGFFTFANEFGCALRDFRSFGATDIIYFARPDVMDTIFAKLPDIESIFQPGVVYNYGPEYAFIKNIENQGFTPYRIDFKYGRDWEILRDGRHDCRRESLRHRLIRFNFKFKHKNHIIFLKLWILPGILPAICNIRCGIFDFLSLDLSIGQPVNK